MINQVMNHVANAINGVDNRIALIAGSMVLGYLLIPIALRIAKVAFDVFANLMLLAGTSIINAVRWIGNTSVIVNIRSLWCQECANHHRSHTSIS